MSEIRTESHIENIQASKLTVDPQVQRSLDKTRVNRMANKFDPAGVGVVAVSRREDGVLHVVDGQQRVATVVAAGHGDAEIRCEVYEGLTLADEARLFGLRNETRRVLPVYRFKIRVVEGDEQALILDGLLRKHGWHVEQSKGDACFAAVTALEKVYETRTGSEEIDPVWVVDTMLAVIVQAWGYTAHGVRAELVQGIGFLLARFGGRVDLAKLINQLAKHEGRALGVLGRARGVRAFRGGRIGDAVAEVLVAEHNFQLPEKSRRRLPDWRTAG